MGDLLSGLSAWGVLYLPEMSSDERRQRARARQRNVVLHKTRLGAEERDFSPVEGAEAISLLTRLSKESYQLAGLAEPTYERHQIRIRFVRAPWS